MIEMKDDGTLDQRGRSGSSEIYFGSGCILKEDSIRFAAQLGCGVKERGQVFWPELLLKDEVPLLRWRKTAGFGEDQKFSFEC